MTYDRYAITTTSLVALSQPQQGDDLLSGKVVLGQSIDVRDNCLFECCTFTIFFQSDMWVPS